MVTYGTLKYLAAHVIQISKSARVLGNSLNVKVIKFKTLCPGFMKHLKFDSIVFC